MTREQRIEGIKELAKGLTKEELDELSVWFEMKASEVTDDGF